MRVHPLLRLFLLPVSAALAASAAQPETADDTVYADEPYWYKPGHPIDPADAASIKTLAGFVTERILTVPRELGSWTAIATDDRGRLIASAQHLPGLYRVTPAIADDPSSQTRLEKLSGVAETVGWSQGLLYAHDSLYVTVAEDNETTANGVHRLRDTDGDDQFDEMSLVLALDAAGEHGPHNLVAGPDGESVFLIVGNNTRVPEMIGHRRPVSTTGIDRLLPPAMGSSRYTTGGWIVRMGLDGENPEVIASGLRNSYDLAFNKTGDLFTFDSDMEYDMGTPWYRPTRICHLVSGGEFGWRPDAAKWPEYYEDSVPPVLNVGPGSPTGMVFGHVTNFPGKYRQALFVCDWTFASIQAVHLTPRGAGFTADIEEFVGGTGLPITDVVAGGDGALYFIVGGRKLGSAVYRVRHEGNDQIDTDERAPVFPKQAGQLHALRRQLESMHGRADPSSLDAAWPHMGHEDRLIRFAARVIIETQPVESWRDRALAADHVPTSLNALLALARQGTPADQLQVITRLARIDWASLTTQQRFTVLRIHQLALARGADHVDPQKDTVRLRLRAALPDADRFVNRELTLLLGFLGDASIIDAALDLMDSDTGDRPILSGVDFTRNPKYGKAVRDMLEAAPKVDRMHHAQMLLWLKSGWTTAQHQRYFELIADALLTSKGGHQYRNFWHNIRDLALDQIPEGQRPAFAAIGAKFSSPMPGEGISPPQGPGRAWTVDEAVNSIGAGLRGQDFHRGRNIYAASACITCHRFKSEGGAIGPDLSTVGQRFTVRDLLDSIINPSHAVSDQYQMTLIETHDGKTFSGRITSRDENTTHIATDLTRPTQASSVTNDSIQRESTVPVSTMPSGLINGLNEQELLDLLAYLVSGGDPEHPVFEAP